MPWMRVEVKSCHTGGCKNSLSPQKQCLTALFYYITSTRKSNRDSINLAAPFPKCQIGTLKWHLTPRNGSLCRVLPESGQALPCGWLRHLLRCKGGCVEITLLALPGDSRGADHRGRISLEFRRQHLDGMAKPYFDLTSVIQSCDTIGRRGAQKDSWHSWTGIPNAFWLCITFPA